MSDQNYWTGLRRRKISRRTMLGASAKAGVGAAGLALVGCGDDDDDDDASTAEAQAEEQAEQAEQAQAEPEEEEEQAVAAGGPVFGGKIVTARDFGIDGGWNPFISLTGADHGGYLKYIYDSVLGYDDNGRVQPELAETWEIPNETTYIFNFAPGRAQFQDGAPVDANAMQLNMEYVQSDPDAAGNSRAQTAIADSQFEAVDEVSWRMVKEEPFGPTIVGFYGNPGAGMLISPNAFETAITDPVGAGPARVVDYQDGERWLAEKWDGYWDNDHVYADELEILIRPDANARWAAFLDGEMSYAEPPGGMTADLRDDLEADGLQVGLGIWQTWMGQSFNLNPSAEGFNMFRDPRLRKALNLSVDRDAVNDVGLDGLGKPSVTNTSTESWAIQPGKNYYDLPDFQKSNQLRDAAGFGDDNPVSGVFLGFGTDFHRRTAEPVFNQLLERGWDLEYFDASESVVLDRFFQAADFATACLSWESPFDPDVTMRPTIELLLKGWMYGSPEDGPGTGRASLADYPNDEVLQGFAETEALLNEASSFAAQEDRLEPYDRLFASFGDGNDDIEGHSWTYNWVQYSRGVAAQDNIGGFRLRPVDGDVDGDGYRGLWINT